MLSNRCAIPIVTWCIPFHRRRNRAGDPPTKLLGKQVIHPAQSIFCNLQLKVTSQTVCKVTFNTKILENSPASGDFAPYPIVYLFWKNAYCIKSYFEFACLDCFSPIFLVPNRKIVPALYMFLLVMTSDLVFDWIKTERRHLIRLELKIHCGW